MAGYYACGAFIIKREFRTPTFKIRVRTLTERVSGSTGACRIRYGCKPTEHLSSACRRVCRACRQLMVSTVRLILSLYINTEKPCTVYKQKHKLKIFLALLNGKKVIDYEH